MGDSSFPTEVPTCSCSRMNSNQHALLLSEDKMRRRLQFFFMNPIEKWHAKRRFPFKFVVQLIKIILVTLQLCLFAQSRYNHITYTSDNRLTFCHLFLRGWDVTREVHSYPPSAGPFAIYKEDDFYATIDYAFNGYSNLSKAIGPYSYSSEDNVMPDMVLCLTEYKNASIFGFNESYIFDADTQQRCWNFSRHHTADSENILANEAIDFNRMVAAQLKFSVKTINLKSQPSCYRFDVSIDFDNSDHDGQMRLFLNAVPFRLQCHGEAHYMSKQLLNGVLKSLLNYLVIIICLASFLLCSRALWRAHLLKRITMQFFERHFGRPLHASDRNKFLNWWYVMIIVNDSLIVLGSAIKEQIESKDFTSDQWNVCSVLLGLGNMLVWFGLLRYLTFFMTYNMVILTIHRAAPQVLRFLLCAVLIYAGFLFSGWLILGPYHMKFTSLSTTSECLFSLINGDDMFATFSTMSIRSTMLWWFSRIYLYTFIGLFIYIVLSLFMSVILDAYEAIKRFYEDGFPKSELEQFVGDTSYADMERGVYRSASAESIGGLVNDMCCNGNCCWPRYKSYASMGHTEHSPKQCSNDNNEGHAVEVVDDLRDSSRLPQ